MFAIKSTAFAQQADSELIDRATVLYDAGNYDEAELIALRALANAEQLPVVDQARLHRLLGFIYVVRQETEKAKLQFFSWLELDRFASLDPLYISPKIIAVFDQAKLEFEECEVANAPPDFPQIDLQLKALKRSLLFPGLGQLYQDQQLKGFALVVSEVILLGSFAYCQINYERARDDYLSETNPDRMQDRYDDYNLYYRGRYASLILAAGVYLYSLFDITYFPPEEQPVQADLSFMISPRATPVLMLSIRLP